MGSWVRVLLTMRGVPALTFLLLIATMTSCAPAPGKPGAVPGRTIDPTFVHGTDGSDIDRLAATSLRDLQAYWGATFPATFGHPWRDLDGGFYSVDTNDPDAQVPPCSTSATGAQGNAYYCEAADAIAWDRAALLPVLRAHYGVAAVVVVLAHEYGHAVQQRSGADTEQSVRTEAMADCYSGSFVKWVVDGRAPHLRINPEQLDGALRALIKFRDAPGTAQSSLDPHGTSFDRVSAFQGGYREGPRGCDAVTEESSAAQHTDEHVRTLDQILDPGAPTAYFHDLTSSRRRPWTAPVIGTRQPCAADRDAVALCLRPRSIAIDRGALAAVQHDTGDQAAATLLASRYALSALGDLGRPVTGPEASRLATCLTGAYTGSLRGMLSPGDLDSAVETLLNGDGVSRDAAGGNTLTGFDRVAAFRTGVVGSADACGV